ncbi:ATP-dependent DNA helicase DinG [Rhodoferax saidenbachensis]|uniref:ATP-dependent DNA helicase DinG n=1 Tax=Rhodoferax saidenbachensis TaxID=1484693 RepID=A0A1P8KFV3_9BURK|nr:ATP-dependent DNA helicase DinG [Rhodoferax saidenbachensis]
MAALSLAAFEKVVHGTDGFRPRPGQHAMAQCIADTLAQADLGEHATPTKAIAVIQAGTGVGKSAAYASTAIAMALERKTRVLISTATVALQEQLMTKDLPALAASMDKPFAYALAKGRGRYVCKVKLERLVGTGAGEEELFDDDMPQPKVSALSQEAIEERRQSLYESMAHKLAVVSWDGDRDTLPDTPDPRDWSAVAAERHTCTARHCPRYKECSYYNARTKLAEANVIVANHDLVLASLGMKTLPDLDNCLVVFDEGHHLPAVALDQFSSAMDLSNLRWLDKLPKTMNEVAGKLALHLGEDVQTVTSQLKGALTTLARMAMDLVWAQTGRNAQGSGNDGTLRFANGVLPEALVEPTTQIHAQASGLSKVLEALGVDVKAVAKDDPSQAVLCAQLYAHLGGLAPRLASLVSTSQLLLEHGEQPLAKWLQAESESSFLTMTAHACPIVPGDLLRQFLWSQVRGAIVTSASLTSCGSFDYFLKEAGLSNKPYVTALEVASPFDYAAQGTLTVVHTRADPKQADAYTAEMVGMLMDDIEQVKRGALVLFTSRAQMRAATEAAPGHLMDMVLVQGTQSRARLLAAHTARVESGMPSVLFGLQSFGEGLDLPGALCETVFIAKLPFAPPSDPVDEARAEWLRSVGRDPFNELVIPATGIKLLQWTGRAIRTEEDHAHVVCYDKRLTLTAYGRRMLSGLPPYRQEQRKSGGII